MITLTYSSDFISDNTGYSCWVYVSGGKDPAYASHAGYVPIGHTRKFVRNKAHRHALELHRVLTFAGVNARVVDGTHKPRRAA